MSDPIEVRRHIWESLVSMLRVYAHAASLNGNAHVISSGPDAAQVDYGESMLRIGFSADSGAGSWRLTRPEGEEQGQFQIEEDGALILPGGPRELDRAAIDWVDKLVQPLRQPLGIS